MNFYSTCSSMYPVICICIIYVLVMCIYIERVYKISTVIFANTFVFFQNSWSVESCQTKTQLYFFYNRKLLSHNSFNINNNQYNVKISKLSPHIRRKWLVTCLTKIWQTLPNYHLTYNTLERCDFEHFDTITYWIVCIIYLRILLSNYIINLNWKTVRTPK